MPVKRSPFRAAGFKQREGRSLSFRKPWGKNIVRGEEFNSILEGAFPIALAAARGIERTAGSIGLLRTEIIKGRVTSEEFFRGILAGGDEIDRQFALTTPTIGQAFTVINTGLVRSAEALNTISAPLAGFIRDVGLAITAMAGVEQQELVTPEQVGRIEFITDAIEGLRTTVVLLAATLGGRLLQSLVNSTAALGSQRAALIANLQASQATAALEARRAAQLVNRTRLELQAAAGTNAAAGAQLRLFQTTNALTGATDRLSAAQARLAAATSVSGRALSFLGGPAGVALLAAAAIFEITRRVREADEALRRALPSIENYRMSLENLTTAQLETQGIRDRRSVAKYQGRNTADAIRFGSVFGDDSLEGSGLRCRCALPRSARSRD